MIIMLTKYMDEFDETILKSLLTKAKFNIENNNLEFLKKINSLLKTISKLENFDN